MQTNPYPIVAVAIESINPLVDIEQNHQHPNTCDCDIGSSSKACICTDCKCHLRRRQILEMDSIVIPIPPARIQCLGYGCIISTLSVIAVYMLLQPKQ
jgi:hypothetical protein